MTTLARKSSAGDSSVVETPHRGADEARVGGAAEPLLPGAPSAITPGDTGGSRAVLGGADVAEAGEAEAGTGEAAEAEAGEDPPPGPERPASRPDRRTTPAPDEAFLVRAARRGDLDAFGELLRRHEQPAFRIALRMLGSISEAEDATQDAFLKAWRALPGFRGDSAFGTWLYRITTNRCLNVIAARRPVDPLDESREGDRRDDPSTVAERREQMSALTASIGRLPAEQRAALVLREFEGLPYDEIAEVLEISLAAVKGRIHRARAQIALDLAGFR